jgi:hypothetical protein
MILPLLALGLLHFLLGLLLLLRLLLVSLFLSPR